MAQPGNQGDMTVEELKARMDRGEAPLIVDVREPAEFEICRIPGAVLIPLNQLPSRIGELDPEKEVVLIVCHDHESRAILDAVTVAGKLDTPGMGIADVVPIIAAVGLIPTTE